VTLCFFEPSEITLPNWSLLLFFFALLVLLRVELGFLFESVLELSLLLSMAPKFPPSRSGFYCCTVSVLVFYSDYVGYYRDMTLFYWLFPSFYWRAKFKLCPFPPLSCLGYLIRWVHFLAELFSSLFVWSLSTISIEKFGLSY